MNLIFITKLDLTGSFVYALWGQHLLVNYNAIKGTGKTKKIHKFAFMLNLRKCHWIFSMDIDIFFKSLGLSFFYIVHFLKS